MNDLRLGHRERQKENVKKMSRKWDKRSKKKEGKKEGNDWNEKEKEWENVFSFPIENLSMAMTDQK